MRQRRSDAGQFEGPCWRTSCLTLGATWFNRVTMRFYCVRCAGAINRVNPDVPGGPLLARSVAGENPFALARMVRHAMLEQHGVRWSDGDMAEVLRRRVELSSYTAEQILPHVLESAGGTR